MIYSEIEALNIPTIHVKFFGDILSHTRALFGVVSLYGNYYMLQGFDIGGSEIWVGSWREKFVCKILDRYLDNLRD